MDLLQAFYFTFAGDAKSLDDALTDSEKKSKGLEDSLQGTDKIAEKLGANFLKMAKTAGTALTSILALGALKKLTLDTADHTYQVYQQARAMGVSTETLSAWQHTVVSAGGTADQAAASMETLRGKFIELTRFGGVMGQDAFMFRKLGLTPAEIKASVKDPTIALVKLSDTFGKLNQTQALFLGKRLGLDPATIALLSQGRRALEEQIERQKRLGVVTTEQAMAAAQFKMQTAELGTVLETVGREITTAVLPPLTWLLKKTEDLILYFRDHKSFVIAFFTGVAAVVSAVYVPAMLSAARATVLALLPIIGIPLIIAAVIAAVALFADDLYNFMEGNASVLGTIAKHWKGFGDVVRGVVHLIGGFLEVLQATIIGTGKYIYDLFELLINVFTMGPMKALDLFSKKTGDIAKSIAGHFSGVIKGAKEFATGVSDIWDGLTTNKAQIGGTSTAAKVTASGAASPEAVAAANATQAKYGVPAAVTLAQYQLESGNGAHMPAGSNNPFGIKAKAGQPYVEAMTTEVINGKTEHVMQRFAKYDSLADAFDAHAKLLANGSAYSEARKHADDPNAYADALTGKYATDPQYGTKLRAIIAKQKTDGTTPAKSATTPTTQPGPVSGSKPNTPKDTLNSVKAAQQTIAATNVPMSTQGSGVIANNTSSSRTTNVDVGGVTVHAPGADGAAIGQSVGGSLEKHLAHAVDQNDDGMVI